MREDQEWLGVSIMTDIHPTKRLWRTLVRVTHLFPSRGLFSVVIPAWDAKVWVPIEQDSVPEEVRGILCPGKRLHVKVNIGAEDAKDLVFREWEKE